MGRDLSGVLLGEQDIEMGVAYLPAGTDDALERWKFYRYWDNPAMWTSPNVQDVLTIVEGVQNQPGRKVATTTVKATNPTSGQVAPPDDQLELYNLTTDPTEMTNLAGNPAYALVQGEMQTLLNSQRAKKRLSPTVQPWADGTMKQFPFTPG